MQPKAPLNCDNSSRLNLEGDRCSYGKWHQIYWEKEAPWSLGINLKTVAKRLSALGMPMIVALHHSDFGQGRRL